MKRTIYGRCLRWSYMVLFSACNDAEPLGHKAYVKFTAYPAGFTIEMNGTFSLSMYMQ